MPDVAAALAEYLGAADFLRKLPAMFLDSRLSSHEVLRWTGIVAFLEVFFRLMALEGSLPEAEFAELHARLCICFGRVRRGVDNETAAEG
jgi:hypothetical protein